MNNIVLVNRNNSIDLNYIPDDLEPCDYRTNGHFYYGSCIRRETLINFLK